MFINLAIDAALIIALVIAFTQEDKFIDLEDKLIEKIKRK